MKTCEEIGFKSTLLRFDENVKEQLLLDNIKKLNVDDEVDGILVQLPLPKHISEEKVLNTVIPTYNTLLWEHGIGALKIK